VISLLLFFVLYTTLAIVGFRLLLKAIRKGPEEPSGASADAPGVQADPAMLTAH
jgi:cytochrome d ubiquinol oxidase subunit I